MDYGPIARQRARYVFPDIMESMHLVETENAAAIFQCSVSNPLMTLICSSVNAALPFFSPLLSVADKILSLSFSAADAQRKCFGFTQRLSLQATGSWAACILPGGFTPEARYKAALWAVNILPSIFVWPYPLGPIEKGQMMQSSLSPDTTISRKSLWAPFLVPPAVGSP